MARQDIHMDAALGEVSLRGNLAGKSVYPFELVSEDELYCYGEVTVGEGFKSDMAHCYISYTAKYKTLKVRFKYELLGGMVEFVKNPTTNQVWFEVFREPKQPIRISEYRTLNEDHFFALVFSESYITIYSGDDTDMEIKPSLSQNETFLLKALASNIYQHPTTGVGLITFLHGNFENTGLAAKLKKEFESDSMVINNAYMDSATGELLLEVTEKESNG